MTTAERLEELLDDKDSEIRRLQAMLDEIDEQRAWRWTMHTERAQDTHDLPVPRLEIRCEPISEGYWGAQVWTYSLVYRHFIGHLVWVPLGATKRTGGAIHTPPPLDDLPFRDGAHITHDALQLDLPAFSIVEDRTYRIPLRDSSPA